MELASLHHIKTRNLFSPLPLQKIKHFSSIPSQLTQHPGRIRRNDGSRLSQRLNKKVALAAEPSNCGTVEECENRELERELEAEMYTEGDEWMGMGKWRDKCEGKGLVELLECLEREAIMGEDEGKDPTDYNRRAQIFDKSSRVFQALKERNNITPTTHQS